MLIGMAPALNVQRLGVSNKAWSLRSARGARCANVLPSGTAYIGGKCTESLKEQALVSMSYVPESSKIITYNDALCFALCFSGSKIVRLSGFGCRKQAAPT